MEQSAFKIEGMTCQNCVQTITGRLSNIAGVQDINVSLENKEVVLNADRPIKLAEAIYAITDLTKYKISSLSPSASNTNPSPSKLKTYKPLIIIFSYVFLVSVAFQISQGSFHLHLFMNHIMAGFFIGLSFFKFLDLKAFAESFSSYDPIAQRWLFYGKIYPFIELTLGALFIAGVYLNIANMLTIIVLAATTYGVYNRLQSKSNFQCACLGTGFSLPLSWVTISENLVMICMAAFQLFN